ncbi:MAG: glycosyltransferase family 39 protein [Streptosporangiaceae bacterium]
MTSPRGSSAVGRPAEASDVSTGQAGHAAAQAAPAASAGPPPADAQGPGPEPRRPGLAGFDLGPRWTLWLSAIAGFLIALVGTERPSYWRDEAATLAAVRRPLGDLVRMLGNVDAVHGAYYLMVWPVEHVLGASPIVMRFPSAVAVGIGAALVAATGRRLISPWAGLAAGLLYAIFPAVSRYGEEARSYAFVMAAAALASYLLVRLLAAEPSARKRWLIWYGAGIAALGILNIFGLLLLPAHAITVALVCRRARRDQAQRRLALGWLIAAVAGVIVASPLLLLGWQQRGQIAWLGVNTSSSGLNTLFSLTGSYLVTTVTIAVILVALVLGTERSREQRLAAWPWRLAETCLPWLVVPPLILLAASTVQPVYTSRYILICIPAFALVGGAAIASYGRAAGLLALGAVLVAGAPTQLQQRAYDGHYDNIKALDYLVAKYGKPGDHVLYANPNAESFGAAYSYGLGTLPNIAQARAADPSGTLAGTMAPVRTVRNRLGHASRVWVVEINSFDPEPQLLGLNGLPVSATPIMNEVGLSLTTVWHEHGDYLLLFTRQ